MANYLGDIRLGDTIDFKFTTRQISGAPFTLAGSPVLSCYPANSTTELTAGITLTVDFDSRTGFNHVRVVASSGNGYATATDYDVVITTGSVNSVSVVGECIGSFSIEHRSALMPTVAARTLDVSAGGEGGLDWANIGSPTTAVALSATTIKATNQVTTGTAQAGAINTITLAAGASSTDGTYDPSTIRIISGTGAGQSRLIIDYAGSTRIAAIDRDWRTTPDNTSVYEIVSSTNLISTNEGLAQGGSGTTITLNATASAVDDCYKGQTVVLRTSTGQDQARIITSYVGATKIATVGEAWTTNPSSTTGYIIWPLGRVLVSMILPNAVNASSLATDAVSEIASGVWQDTTAGDFTTALSVGKSLMNGVSLGTGLTVNDITTKSGFSLSGTQTFNVTGNITGNLSGSVGSVTGLTASNLDATISSRMATYTQPTGFLAATFPTGTVANTTNITAGTITTVTNLTNAPTAGDLTATMKASVTTSATASLATTTYAEPGQGAPGATLSLADKISFLYKFMRNRITQSATTMSVYADDATTVDQKAAVSDSGTLFDRGEITSGP